MIRLIKHVIPHSGLSRAVKFHSLYECDISLRPNLVDRHGCILLVDEVVELEPHAEMKYARNLDEYAGTIRVESILAAVRDPGMSCSITN